jgi:hypothetical protein
MNINTMKSKTDANSKLISISEISNYIKQHIFMIG